MTLFRTSPSPPQRWPSGLERLVGESKYILDNAIKINKAIADAKKNPSEGEVSASTDMKLRMTRLTHKYSRLIEFIEKGYAPTGKEYAYDPYTHDNRVLFGEYLSVTRLKKNIDNNEDFLERYLGEVKSCWISIQELSEKDSEKVELAKNFNEVSEFIGRHCYGQRERFFFDQQKDQWVRGWQNNSLFEP